jgi:hypothetical protein
MERDKYMQILREEITEIEALIDKWRPAPDEGTNWAIGLLEMCLFRRMQLVVALSRYGDEL